MLARRAPLAFPPLLLAMLLALAVPAGAVHFFPLFPGDPGGDCAAALESDPGGSATHIGVGLFTFTDETTGNSTSQVKVGDSVTWRWDVPFCHSVIFQSSDIKGTDGGQPCKCEFDPEVTETQLVKPDGNRNTFTAKFDQPGTYGYFCVHHASLGMTGTVVVS